MMEDIETLQRSANNKVEGPVFEFDLQSWVEISGSYVEEANVLLTSCRVNKLSGKGIYVVSIKNKVEPILRKLNEAQLSFVTLLMALQVEIQRMRYKAKEDGLVQAHGGTEAGSTTKKEKAFATTELGDLP
jgi:hypothetical protein